jgi:hypothetical protein
MDLIESNGLWGIHHIIFGHLIAFGKEHPECIRTKKQRRHTLRTMKMRGKNGSWPKIHHDTLAQVYMRQWMVTSKFWYAKIMKFFWKNMKPAMVIEKCVRLQITDKTRKFLTNDTSFKKMLKLENGKN